MLSVQVQSPMMKISWKIRVYKKTCPQPRFKAQRWRSPGKSEFIKRHAPSPGPKPKDGDLLENQSL